MPLADSFNSDSGGERDASGQQHHQFAFAGGLPNFTSPQVSHSAFIPFRTLGGNSSGGLRVGNDNIPAPNIEAQEQFLQHQIEIIHQQKPDENKGKCLSLSSDNK